MLASGLLQWPQARGQPQGRVGELHARVRNFCAVSAAPGEGSNLSQQLGNQHLMAAATVLFQLYLILQWIFLSSTIILFNKWLISTKHFQFPLTIVIMHMMFESGAAKMRRQQDVASCREFKSQYLLTNDGCGAYGSGQEGELQLTKRRGCHA